MASLGYIFRADSCVKALLFLLLVLQVLILLLLSRVLLLRAERSQDNQPQPQQQEQEEQQQQQTFEINKPSSNDLVPLLEQELPEVNYGFWLRRAKLNNNKMYRSCASYPSPLDLQYHNIYWQTFINGKVTFRLYAAYLDVREDRYLGVVRILATANQNSEHFPLAFCQLWYENHSMPLVLPVKEYHSAWMTAWKAQPHLDFPHLLSCPLPKSSPGVFGLEFPSTVSLVSERCQNASNTLRVNYEAAAPPKTSAPPVNASLSIGVCLKGFDFPHVDVSERLIEWFELQRLLGASGIYAYLYAAHPAVQRVLGYYQSSGYLQLRPLTQANGMPPLQHYHHLLLEKRASVKRLNELIAYNDCFYRNMYRHDYLLNVDVDELVMPQGELRTWQQLLASLPIPKISKKSCAGGFVAVCVSNAFFHQLPDSDPAELYFLQHTLRYDQYAKDTRFIKCFHNSRYSLTLHNHVTVHFLGGCENKLLSTRIAHLQHYRDPKRKFKYPKLIEDRSIWKYASELRAAVANVRGELHLLKESQSEKRSRSI